MPPALAQSVTGVNPSSGPQGRQALEVTISGSGLFVAQSVSFGADIVVSSAYNYSGDGTSFQVNIYIADTAVVGPRTVTVNDGVNDYSLTDGFTVTAAPKINMVDPPSGYTGTDSLVIDIQGENLEGTTMVNLGGNGVGVVGINSVDMSRRPTSVRSRPCSSEILRPSSRWRRSRSTTTAT